MRRDLPSGTVTFLFTDVEGSTRLLHELGTEAYAAELAVHRRLIRETCAAHDGVEVDTQGDAFFFAFPTAPGALSAAKEVADALATGPVHVRTGLHTGTPLLVEEGYVGHDVHRAARIAAAGHGGQVLVSASTAALVTYDLLRDLGEHRFKDLAARERVYQHGTGDFPQLRSLYRTNLPVPATPFLGRERELLEALELLARDDVRMVTLTGPGGTGKTRLALQLAAESSDRYPDGIWWVPLAPLRDAAAVPAQIAQAVGATGELAAHIADQRMLVLLDNFEHLLDAAPGIGALLASCPNLEVIATSRELLQLQAENAYAVPMLEDADALRLFRARAVAVAADLSGDRTVGELCRRLDNLPLAIELAAARTRHLSPAQLLERLSQRLDLLQAGRDADPRQQTLRATIEWSYELLGEDERRVFARLSVFPGGCTLELAELVCDADLDTIASLVDKSLVRKTGERFWMLQTIRDFAAERLDESGETESLRRRQAEFLLNLARSLGFTVEAIEAGAVQRHDIAIAEGSNFRAAIAWATDVDPELALGIAFALENFWISFSPYDAARIFAELAKRLGDGPAELRAQVARCRANLAIMTGELEAGFDFYRESAELYKEVGDEHASAILQFRIGSNLITRGDTEQGRRLLEESLTRSRELGFRINELMVQGRLGSLEYQEGNVEHGLELIEQSVVAARDAGFKWWEANLLGSLAEHEIELGRTDDAEQHGRALVVLARDMGDRRHAVNALGILAKLAAGRSEADRAGRLWGAVEAEELRGPLGRRPRTRDWEEDRETFVAAILADPTPELERALDAGRRLALEDAIVRALEESDA
jgi:predicted ATPase/class 3 adenylate cyclase